MVRARTVAAEEDLGGFADVGEVLDGLDGDGAGLEWRSYGCFNAS